MRPLLFACGLLQLISCSKTAPDMAVRTIEQTAVLQQVSQYARERLMKACHT